VTADSSVQAANKTRSEARIPSGLVRGQILGSMTGGQVSGGERA
jgi:hypothetical protein